MRIERLEVKGFGSLQDVTIDLHPDQPIVLLHGANEAGKSTIMQFIRAILFGFASRGALAERYEPVGGGGMHGGVLWLRDEAGRRIKVQRIDMPGVGGRRPSSGTVTVTLEDGTSGGEELLQRILGDITGEMYRHLFAFGLTELQEVRTLQSDEVSGYLYSAGFGSSGAAILDAERRLQAAAERLFKPRGKKQALGVLTEQLDQINSKIRAGRDMIDRYNAKLAALAALEQRIAESSVRLLAEEARLSWLDKCLRAQEPWEQLRSAERELAEMPQAAASSTAAKEALRRFEEEQSRLNEMKDIQQQLVERLELLAHEAEEYTSNAALLSCQQAIKELHQQSMMIDSWQAELQEAEQEKGRLQEQILAQITRIDASWTEQHVTRLHISLADRSVISAYRDRRDGLVRRMDSAKDQLDELLGERDRLTKHHNELKQQVVFAERELRTHYAGRLAILSPASRRERLQQLNRLLDGWRRAERNAEYVKLRRQEEQARRGTVRNLLIGCVALTVILPTVLFVLGEPFAALTGAAVMLAMDLVLAVLWWNGGGGSRTRRMPRQSDAEQEKHQHSQHLQELLSELVNAEAEAAPTRARASGEPEAGWTLEHASMLVEQLEAASDQLQADELDSRRQLDRLAVLERQLADTQERVRSQEELLTELRNQHGELVHEWQAWLEERLLPPQLTPETALDLFNIAEQAKQLIRHRDQIQDRIDGYSRRIAAFVSQVDALCEDLGLPSDKFHSSIAAVKFIFEQLEVEMERRERKQSLLEQHAERMEEHEALQARIERAEQRIASLLVEAGAEDEADLRKRAELNERHEELRRIVNQAYAQLEWLVSLDGVEQLKEMLIQTGGVELQGQRAECAATLAELREQIDKWRDERAKLEVELDDLRQNAEQAELLQSKEEHIAELNRQAADYMVVTIAGRLLRQTRERYERERQPKVLQEASRYMAAISQGRYMRIIAPFGEQRLIAERVDGEQVDAAYLSRGTREQLYLAMRLALVEVYSTRHEPLPIVMDDVLVNFDEERAAHTLQVIQEFGKRHQVLLFTCHDYMRRLFTQRVPEGQVITLA